MKTLHRSASIDTWAPNAIHIFGYGRYGIRKKIESITYSDIPILRLYLHWYFKWLVSVTYSVVTVEAHFSIF